MNIKLESYVDGQLVMVEKDIDPRSEFGQLITAKGWPEVVICAHEAFTLQEFDILNAMYMRVTVQFLP